MSRLTHNALRTTIAISLMVLGGCGSTGNVVQRETLFEFSDDDRAAIAASEVAPYTLQRGDIFSVNSLVDEELTQKEVLVLPDGSSSFVGLGSMTVAGKTTREIEALLDREYSTNYRDVDLTIVVHQTSGRQVYVLGEVRNPGLYDVSMKGVGVISAIAQAGGLGNWASEGSVVLMRLTPTGYLCRELDLKSLRKGTFDAAALDLRPYDIIWVSRSKIGDFASFTTNVVGSLNQYTRLILDALQINDPTSFRR